MTTTTTVTDDDTRGWGVKEGPNDRALGSYSTVKPLDADVMRGTGLGYREGNGAQDMIRLEPLPM